MIVHHPLARAAVALFLVVGAGAMSACDVRELGSYRPVTGPDRPAPTTVPTPEKPVAKEPAPKPRQQAKPKPAAIVLRAKVNDKFGTLVVDRHGRTLYRGDADSTKPSRSRCAAKCLEVWHPALVGAAAFTVAGIDPDLVGTIKRGRSRQLTLAGWPVYTFAKDQKAGDVKGQCGRGFFAITPEGRRASMTARAA